MSTNQVNILSKIQAKLKAPKNQRNTFGNYNYRSCEDILEGLKPLLEELKCAVVVSDDIKMMENSFYVVATAQLYLPNGQIISANGWAREPRERKGMDHSQITGATSSYARKYALNGLFAIDDAKDPDATNDGDDEDNKKACEDNKPWLNENDAQFDAIKKAIQGGSRTMQQLREHYKVSKKVAEILDGKNA